MDVLPRGSRKYSKMSGPLSQILNELHPLERDVLNTLKDTPILWESKLIEGSGLDESRVSMALGWLLTKEIVRVQSKKITRIITITDIGKKYAEHGFPEDEILKILKEGKSLGVRGLQESYGMDSLEVSKAIGNLKNFEIVKIVQGGTLEILQDEPPKFFNVHLRKLLKRLAKSQGEVEYDELIDDERLIIDKWLEKSWKTRGVIKERERKEKQMALTELGSQLVEKLAATKDTKEEAVQLCQDDLKKGTWREKVYRKFNIGLKAPRQAIGRKHAYREFLDSVKAKLTSMGFIQMQGPLVESEFWNSDALYMPQFHPARDIHDVYFIKHPRSISTLPEPFASQVAETHRSGWQSGSQGWRYDFDLERAKRFVLRSQGTAVSARTLSKNPNVPGKYFSIARCFRYDTVDATHAPDFYQIEGIALGPQINFRVLLGLLRLFANEMARAPEVRYVPAYFPYTEPSVELHVRHPALGWMELGGAGLFRPEVTLPLGIEVPVIAWGLGLDRMAMMALGIKDIRDLFSSDLDLIRVQRVR